MCPVAVAVSPRERQVDANGESNYDCARLAGYLTVIQMATDFTLQGASLGPGRGGPPQVLMGFSGPLCALTLFVGEA